MSDKRSACAGLLLFSLASAGFFCFLMYTGLCQYTLPGNFFSVPSLSTFSFLWEFFFLVTIVGAAFVCRADPKHHPRSACFSAEKKRALRTYVFQMLIHLFWPVLFFYLHLRLLSFFLLLFLILLMLLTCLRFWEICRTAGLLQLPCLLWLFFAAYLNLSVYRCLLPD